MSEPRQPSPPTGYSPPWRDVIIVIAVTLLAAVLSAHFEFSETLFTFTRRWESLQLDELPPVLFVLAIALAWLAWRRYQQTRIQLRARREAEMRLEGVLAENRRLAQQHVRIQEFERKHLARELHDELGQYLNAIKLDAVSINESAPHDAAARKTALQIIQSVDHVHSVVSDMIRRLRPAGLDELGLVAALENCVDHWRRRRPQTRFSLSVHGNFDGLGEMLNLTVYRLIQEGLTNGYKHAGAQQIDIVLQRNPATADAADEHALDELVLSVVDDGQGMSMAGGKTGFGLSGMRERVQMMGGTFTIDSAPGRGLSFEARLPAGGYE